MIKEFATHLSSIKGQSENTVKAYVKDLHDFVKYVKGTRNDARWSNITSADIDGYVEDMERRQLTPATSNRRLAAIGAIYRYMRRQGYDITNPARYETRKKVGEKEPNTIDIEDLKRALANTKGTIHLIIHVLVTTGIRVQELLDIEKRDIDERANEIKIHGKGNKERTVPTTEECMKELTQYARNMNQGKIFIGWTQRQLRETLYFTMREYSQAPQLSPHAIRHTYATTMAKNGISVYDLGKLMGHTDIKTTQKYIDRGQMKNHEAYNRYRPI